jgi:hypothetical protein
MKAGCLHEFKTDQQITIEELNALHANHIMIRYGTVYPKEDAIVGLGRVRIRKWLTLENLEQLFFKLLVKNGFAFERLRSANSKWPESWSYNNESKLVIRNDTGEEVFPNIYWYVI